MNIIAKTSLLALTGLALVSQSANAALNYTAGDVLLGLRLYSTANSNDTSDLVIDLGTYTQFTNKTFTSLDISAALITLAGTNWSTSTNISWGLIGITSSDASNGHTSILASKGEVSGLTTAYANISRTNATSVVSAINSDFTQVFNGATSNDGTGNGLMTSSPDGVKYSWSNLVSNTSSDNGTGTALSFNVIGASTGVLEANSADSTTLDKTALDLYLINGTSKNPTGNATYVDTLAISDSGVLSLQAVPEPSTYAMIVAGGLGVMGLFRRRSLKA